MKAFHEPNPVPYENKKHIMCLMPVLQVEEAALTCGNAERDEYLYYILAQHPGRTLVFVNAISAVRRVAALLKLLALPAQALHASMQQRQRLKALDRFKADPAGVLVATDVAARGLDVPVGRCAVPCCAVLCCAVLCCAVLCCAGLSWAGLGWAGLITETTVSHVLSAATVILCGPHYTSSPSATVTCECCVCKRCHLRCTISCQQQQICANAVL